MRLIRLLLAGLITATLGFPAFVSAGGAGIEGYLSARFGMSSKEVLAAIKRDEVKLVSQENQQGDLVILAKRNRGGMETELVYVLPANQRLAMVIEFFPGLANADALEQELVKQYGSPVSAKRSKQILEEMGEALPEEVTRLTLWADQKEGSYRLVRLLRYADHMAVEYLDAAQMGSLD